MNSSLYNVISENQLTEVLSHYDTNFVMSVLDNAIASRFNPNAVMRQPNVVAAWEQNFKQYLADFDEMADGKTRIYQVREDTYKEIIGRICKEFNLNFTIDDTVDLYSAAYYLYDFFVANFNANLVSFFCNYIYKERAEIYDSMDLASLRKNKDSSTIYGKKTYKDIRLAVINANIDRVISFICGFDVPMYNIFNIVYPQKELVYYLSTIISDNGDFFKNYYCTILDTSIRPILLTDIRLSIQNIAIERGNDIIMDDNNTDID
jgi:hypothetical protein